MTDDYLKIIQEIKDKHKSIKTRELEVGDTSIRILYIQEIIDTEKMISNIIKPILSQEDSKNILTPKYLSTSVVTTDNIQIESVYDSMPDYIFEGNIAIIILGYSEFLLTNLKLVGKRDITGPEIEFQLKGPKDCFNENYSDNIALIFNRLKDKSIEMEEFVVGDITKTKIAMIYLDSYAKQDIVDNIRRRIEGINTNGLITTGDIQKYLKNNKYQMFPTFIDVEVSAKVSSELLEGKICLIVENSNLPIILPKTFLEFLDVGDDSYSFPLVSLFMKLFRLLCFVITLTLPALFIAIQCYHIDLLPTRYILFLTSTRVSVPFESYIEMFLMLFVIDVILESSERIPSKFGILIGLVGATIIGQTAIEAGLVGPALLIVVALSVITEYTIPYRIMTQSFKYFRYGFLIAASVFGLVGLATAVTIFLIYLFTVDSFGKEYLYPLVPFSFKDLKHYLYNDNQKRDTLRRKVKAKQ